MKGPAAQPWRCGRSSLGAERVQEPEGDRMTAATKYGSPRKLPCGGRSARRTRFPWGEAGVLGQEADKRSRGARRGMGPSTCTRVAEIMGTPRHLGVNPSSRTAVDVCRSPAPGRPSLRTSGAEARVKRSNPLQACGFTETPGPTQLPLDARRAAPLPSATRNGSADKACATLRACQRRSNHYKSWGFPVTALRSHPQMGTY